jgi:hypothetical protein
MHYVFGNIKKNKYKNERERERERETIQIFGMDYSENAMEFLLKNILQIRKKNCS